MNKKIGIVSDHRGVDLKQKLKDLLEKKGYEVKDYGTNSYESADYPTYAFLLGEKIINKEVDLGIAICGTGIGMSIALNKVKGIRCAKIDNNNDAIYAKKHNNANAVAISANNSFLKTRKMINLFLKEELDKNPKHQKRIDLIKEYEQNDKY